MSKFELIEDYLAGRLDEGRQSEFEQELNADSNLRAEVNMQKQIIGGVQKARAMELKAMLNNVPVAGGGSAAVAAGKIAAAVITAGIIGSAIYFGIKEDDSLPQQKPTIEQSKDTTAPTEDLPETNTIPEEEGATPKVEKPSDESLAAEEPKAKRKVTKPVTPKIEVVDPMAEMETETKEEVQPTRTQIPKGSVSVSSIEVENNTEDKKHDFHYQFHTGKLILFGPFDKSLYEIIEINGDAHSIFLYYNQNYYLLDQSVGAITPLKAITDKELILKLNDYRNR